MVALLAGKGLALAAGKPLIAVNHLEGHALSPAAGRSRPRLSLSAAARLGRPLPAARGARGRRLPPPRDDHRRCRRRGVRQGRQAARPRLSRRAGDRGAGAVGRSGGRAAAAPAGRLGRAAFLLRRPEERRAARGRLGRAFAARTSPRASSRRSSIASSTAPRSRSGRSDAPALVVAGGVAANQAIRARSPTSRARDGRAASAFPPPGCAPTMRR